MRLRQPLAVPFALLAFPACAGGQATISAPRATEATTSTTASVAPVVDATVPNASPATVAAARPAVSPRHEAGGPAVRSPEPEATAPNDGWAIPAYVVKCESGGDYGAENGRSSASGAYQITDGTWDGYGGYDRAVHAPPAVQDARAAELWDEGRGKGHWKACL